MQMANSQQQQYQVYRPMENSNKQQPQPQQGMMTAASNLDTPNGVSPSDLISQSSSISTSSILKQQQPDVGSATSVTSDVNNDNSNDYGISSIRSAKLQMAPQSNGNSKQATSYSASAGSAPSSMINNHQMGDNNSNMLGSSSSPNSLQQYQKQMQSISSSSLFSPRHMMMAQADTMHPYTSNSEQHQQSVFGGESQQQQVALQAIGQQQQQQPGGLFNQLSRLWSRMGRTKSILPSMSPFGGPAMNANQRQYVIGPDKSIQVVSSANSVARQR